MTLVLLVSVVVVTRAAWHASPASSSAFAVCPGARTAMLPAGRGAVTSVPSGSLPAQLVSQPARLDLLPVFRHWASVCALPAALVEATCWWESGWQEDGRLGHRRRRSLSDRAGGGPDRPWTPR